MTTVENVTNTLRREILNGEFAGGLRLVEQELTARYGVARHTLRAALRELASEGLVKIEPNRGARVARLSAEDVIELYELRTALEVEAARLALERHHGRLPTGVHDALSTLQDACEQRAWVPINDAHAFAVAVRVLSAQGLRAKVKAFRSLSWSDFRGLLL